MLGSRPERHLSVRGYLTRVVDRPKLGLVVVLAGTIALAAQIPKLRIDNVSTILVKSDDIFSFTTLSAIERLSDQALQLEDVTRVDSLTTVNDVSGTDDSFTTDKLIQGAVTDDAAGFASFAFSDITILKEFGRIAPIAFASSFIVTILLVPACLRYSAQPESPGEPLPGESRGSLLARTLAWLGDLVVDHPRIIMGLALAITAVGVVGLPRIETDNDFTAVFKEGSEIRTRLADTHESLAGGSMLYVVIDAGEEGRAAHADVIKHAENLQAYIDETGKADVAVSAADYVKLMNREMNGGSDEYFTVPDSDALIAQYLVLAYAKRTLPATLTVDVTSESLLMTRAS